jgi:hypothetical protein
MLKIGMLLFCLVPFLFSTPQSAMARENNLKPARISCDAAYSAPCARINSEWLATTTARHLSESLEVASVYEDIWQEVSRGAYNMEIGFYPFVFDKLDARCLAHGANPAFVGRNLTFIFDQAGIGFSNVNNLF